MIRAAGRLGSFFLLCILLSACSSEPQAIHFGEDRCAFCMMTISDARFASQLVTRSGKSINFDSIECMAAHEASNEVDTGPIARRRVSDYEAQTVVDIENVRFSRSDRYNSPMGGGLVAYSLTSDARADDTAMSYEEVLRYSSDLLLRQHDASAITE